MTFYELVLYACLTSTSLSGGYSKTCDWRSEGTLFATKEKCDLAAKGIKGTEIFGDVSYVNAINRYEDAICQSRGVLD